jgi:transposase
MQSYHRVHVELRRQDRRRVTETLSKGQESARVLRRASILRQLDDGQKVAQVAANAGVAAKTVRAIARRYEEEGLDSALHEKPRPGQARVLNAGQKQRIVAMVCGPPPEGRARWSVRLIAEEAAKRKLGPPVSRETIRILLENHELKPWREKNVVYRGDERGVHRAWKTFWLSMKSRCRRRSRWSAWMKNRWCCIADVRPPRPMRPGRVARRDCEYRRRGTANAFCGVQPKAGRHFTKVTPNRSAPQFADYLLEIVAAYPEADTIHLVMDNLSSHRRKALVDRYGESIGGLLWDRFTVHYTPKHGSWLNQAEIEISLFSRQCLGLRRIPSLPDLSREAQAWNRRMNRDHVQINWKFTRTKARQKFGYTKNKFKLSTT